MSDDAYARLLDVLTPAAPLSIQAEALIAYMLREPRQSAAIALKAEGIDHTGSLAELTERVEIWKGAVSDEVDLALSILETAAWIEEGLIRGNKKASEVAVFLNDALELGRLEERLRSIGEVPNRLQRTRSRLGGEATALRAELRWKAAALTEARRIREINPAISNDDLAEKLDVWLIENEVDDPPKRSTLKSAIKRWERLHQLDRSTKNPFRGQ